MSAIVCSSNFSKIRRRSSSFASALFLWTQGDNFSRCRRGRAQWAGGRCYRPLKGRTLAVKLFNYTCCDDVWIDQREDAAHSWFGLSNEGEKLQVSKRPRSQYSNAVRNNAAECSDYKYQVVQTSEPTKCSGPSIWATEAQRLEAATRERRLSDLRRGELIGAHRYCQRGAGLIPATLDLPIIIPEEKNNNPQHLSMLRVRPVLGCQALRQMNDLPSNFHVLDPGHGIDYCHALAGGGKRTGNGDLGRFGAAEVG